MSCSFPWIIAHVRPKGFFTIELIIKDDESYKKISLTNKKTIAVIEADRTRAVLPLALASLEWQYIPIDLSTLTESVFGTRYMMLEQARLKSNCAVRKVFMCDRLYADAELPEYLQAME